MRPRVLVLLASYNGEKYIREQIDSVLEQKGDFDLLLRIRDDGSSDRTREVIRESIRQWGAERIELVEGENLGYNGNFFALLDQAEGFDYYALCDQDDIWLPGKIQAAMEALSQGEGPALYSAISRMVDENKRPLGLTRARKRALTPANTLIQNICPGHNQVLNEALLRLVQKPRDLSRIYVYDLWIANVAALQ
ncbi:MAG: glycosyltransferase, partial [Lachnospiraceae bacterium]|nr:glycosyltransferase [Lachnospiraceae bacterium]